MRRSNRNEKRGAQAPATKRPPTTSDPNCDRIFHGDEQHYCGAKRRERNYSRYGFTRLEKRKDNRKNNKERNVKSSQNIALFENEWGPFTEWGRVHSSRHITSRYHHAHLLGMPTDFTDRQWTEAFLWASGRDKKLQRGALAPQQPLRRPYWHFYKAPGGNRGTLEEQFSESEDEDEYIADTNDLDHSMSHRDDDDHHPPAAPIVA